MLKGNRIEKALMECVSGLASLARGPITDGAAAHYRLIKRLRLKVDGSYPSRSTGGQGFTVLTFLGHSNRKRKTMRFFMSDVQFTSNDETTNTDDQIATAVEIVFSRNSFDDACTILERLGIGART